MAAPAAVADVDAGARHIVDRTMPDGDALGEVYFHAGGLFLHASGQVNQAIVHQAVRRVIIAFRSGRAVNFVKLLNPPIVEQRTARGLRVADKTNPRSEEHTSELQSR